jgi:hypothetical protein
VNQLSASIEMPLITLDVNPELRFASSYLARTTNNVNAPPISNKSNNFKTKHFPAKFPPLGRDLAKTKQISPAKQLGSSTENSKDGGKFSKVQCTLPHEALGLIVSDREDSESIVNEVQTAQGSRAISMHPANNSKIDDIKGRIRTPPEQARTTVALQQDTDTDDGKLLPPTSIPCDVSNQINNHEVSKFEHDVKDSIQSGFVAETYLDSWPSIDMEPKTKAVTTSISAATTQNSLFETLEMKGGSLKIEKLTQDEFHDEAGEEYMTLQEYRKEITSDHHNMAATNHVANSDANVLKDQDDDRRTILRSLNSTIYQNEEECSNEKHYATKISTYVNEDTEGTQPIKHNSSREHILEEYIEDVDWDQVLRQERRNGIMQVSSTFFSSIGNIAQPGSSLSIYFGSGLYDLGPNAISCSEGAQKGIISKSCGSQKCPNEVKGPTHNFNVTPAEITRIKVHLADVKRKREEASCANADTKTSSPEVHAASSISPSKASASVYDKDKKIEQIKSKICNNVSRPPSETLRLSKELSEMTSVDEPDFLQQDNSTRRLPLLEGSSSDESDSCMAQHPFIKSGIDKIRADYFEKTPQNMPITNQIDSVQIFPPHEPWPEIEESNNTYFEERAKKTSIDDFDIKQLIPPHYPWRGHVGSTTDSAIECFTPQKNIKLKVHSSSIPPDPVNSLHESAPFTTRFERLLRLKRDSLVNRSKENRKESISSDSLPQISKAKRSYSIGGPINSPKLPQNISNESHFYFEQHVSVPPPLGLRGSAL